MHFILSLFIPSENDGTCPKYCVSKKGNYQLITKRPKIYAHLREDKYDRIYVVITQTKADEVP